MTKWFRKLKRWFIRKPHLDIPLWVKRSMPPRGAPSAPPSSQITVYLTGAQKYVHGYLRAMLFWCPEGHLFRVPRDHVSQGQIHHCPTCGEEMLCSVTSAPKSVQRKFMKRIAALLGLDPEVPLVQQEIELILSR